MAGCGGKAATPTAGPPDVSVTKVEQRDVAIISEWVATLDGFVNAQIQPQVTGYIIKQNYREGSPVRKGDVLFEIDPRPFQALLDQAKAQLAQSEAQMGKTQLDVDRDTPLAKERAIAQSQLDNDIQANLAAKAAVQSAKAQVEQAALNLGFTHVTSLFDGIAGIAQIQLGNLVNPSTVLTSVSQVNPIKAYFPISEQEYLRLAEHINSTNRTEPAKDAPTASRGHAIRAATGSRIHDAFQRISLGAD
jgi:membrane fusion protein (multidrug efflux system)